jgi:hypothetical protein
VATAREDESIACAGDGIVVHYAAGGLRADRHLEGHAKGPIRLSPLSGIGAGAWFRSVGTEEFVKLYTDEILAPLDPHRVVNELVELALGRVPALLCYEASAPGPDWCHWSLVSLWFHQKLGVEVFELG